jgi:hypothetical protein
MKKYFFLLFFLSVSFFSLAQPGKKPAAKEKPPTQKEMEDMMKEAQKAVDEMSPEDKKMMDSMGIKMPDVKTMKKNVAGVSDAQLKKAFEDDTRIVPVKDAARIATIPSTALTASSVGTFLSSVHNKVTGVLMPASKTLSEQLYAELKPNTSPHDMGNVAVGLWMIGKNEPAIYIMGKACTDDPTNTDNINNYAAMLSMNSGEQLAIPMLNYLNKKYPGNSTILNNLGQAWFGLGDISKADLYLDSTIRIYASHSQATFTKAAIEESKGNIDKAVELVKKSINEAYTQEKEESLRKKGYKLKGADVKLPPKKKQDYLALEKFTHPAFPRTVAESISLEPRWQEFRDELDGKIDKLKKELQSAKDIASRAQEERMNKDIATIRTSQEKGYITGALTTVPLHAAAASTKIGDFMDPDGRMMHQVNNNMEKTVAFITNKGAPREIAYKKEIELLNEQEFEQTGEGKPNLDFCPKKREASDKFLQAFNGDYESLVNESLDLKKQQFNELAYLYMYAQWQEDYTITLLEFKISWLQALSDCGPFPFKSITEYKCVTPIKKEGGELSEFDEVACQYHSEMDFKVFSYKSDCSRSTTEFNAKFIKFKLKQDMDKKTFGDQFMGCTVAVKAKAGESMDVGPVKAGVKVEVGAEAEFDRDGLKDLSVVAGVTANVSVVKAGVEGRISLISGKGSVSGTGIFKGLK